MTEKEKKELMDAMHFKKYEIALATRNFEIELFWKRSLFFWGFIAASFIAYATITKDKPEVAILIACFGFVCSVAWSLVNRGSKYWQENWEIHVEKLEDSVTGSLFKEREEPKNKNFWLSSRKFSVSKVAIALSDFTVLIWLSLMCCHLCVAIPNSVFAVFASILFAIAMAYCGQSSNSRTLKKQDKEDFTD